MATLDNFGKSNNQGRIVINQAAAAIGSTNVSVQSEFSVAIFGHYQTAS